MASATGDPKKKKKTKLEKICELESSLKVLKEENTRLKKELHSVRSKSAEDASIASFLSDGPSIASSVGGSEEKLKEALRSLKKVTVKQELNLTTLRSKARQRRVELKQRDELIEKMEEEIKALKKAHEKLKGIGTDDGATLRARVVDLELQLAKQEAGNKEQSKKLEESKEDINTLRSQLEKMKGRVPRAPSSRSLPSVDSSSASTKEDVSRIKRELAKKTEKVANLEQELEMARDEIHELKRKKQFDAAFPTTPAPGSDDFFSDEDEDEDEDFWGK